MLGAPQNAYIFAPQAAEEREEKEEDLKGRHRVIIVVLVR
jgi:hypothetical protein